MKRTLITLTVAVLLVFATSAIALAENGPIWPRYSVSGGHAVK